MRIIVSDSSCLIDIRKASLLDAFLKLPYEILIPNTLFEDELIKFTIAQKSAMRRSLQVVDLPGEQVLRAQQVIGQVPALSVHDGLAFALAEENAGCTLLTADGALRVFAGGHGIEVHGTLWVLDEMYSNNLAGTGALLAALKLLRDDPTIRLPLRELTSTIRRYENL